MLFYSSKLYYTNMISCLDLTLIPSCKSVYLMDELIIIISQVIIGFGCYLTTSMP